MNVRRSGCWAKVLGLCSMLGGAKGGGNDVTGGGTCSQQRRHRQDSQPKRAPISAAFLEKEGERARIAMSCSAHPRRIVHSALANSACYCYPCTQFFPWQIEDRTLMGALHHNTVRTLSHSHVAKLHFHPARLYALALPVSPIQPRFAIIPNALRRTKRRRAAGG